jgi:hypothetical protein
MSDEELEDRLEDIKRAVDLTASIVVGFGLAVAVIGFLSILSLIVRALL